MTVRDWRAFDAACDCARDNLDYRAMLLAEHGGKRPPRPRSELPALDDETREDLLRDAVSDVLALHGEPQDEIEQLVFDEIVDTRFGAACQARRFELADAETQARIVAGRFARVLGWVR